MSALEQSSRTDKEASAGKKYPQKIGEVIMLPYTGESLPNVGSVEAQTSNNY